MRSVTRKCAKSVHTKTDNEMKGGKRLKEEEGW
jgi:hypothetical protein